MKIAMVAPLFESVPPKLYGGTERVVHYLTEELVRRGHEVTLYASGDSKTSARLIPIVPNALRLAGVKDPVPYILMQVEKVIRDSEIYDLVHSHIDYYLFPFSRYTETPIIHTTHGRLDLPYLTEMVKKHPEIRLTAISESQKELLPEGNFLGVVYHGLPEDLYTFSENPEDYVVFVGRISPEKRLDLAIKAAIKAGIKIKIAAKIDRADREYYEREIKELMKHPLVEYVGEINDSEKNELVGKAKALLMPVDWPEPFGLTAIEALACGTPVIARPCGALRETIIDGETGYLRNSLEELADAIKNVEKIERKQCRKHFEENFTVGKMVDNYEKIYQRLIKEEQSYYYLKEEKFGEKTNRW